MTSVQNHLLPLNGNSIGILLFCLLIAGTSCATRKIVNKPVPKPADKVVINHKNPELPAKVDTLVWKENKDKKSKADKIEDKSMPKEIPPTGIEKKSNKKITKEESLFRIVALLPFKTVENDSNATKINSSSLRYVHFFAGMQMAVQELEHTTGQKIVINVHDAPSIDEVKSNLNKYEYRPPHLIIGPQKSDAVKYAAEWAKNHETSIISPWVSSSSITDKNPFYIQAKAGLNAHYNLINTHARKNFPVENIFLISRSLEESKEWIFNDSTIYAQKIEEKIIKESDLASSNELIVGSILKENGPTVFILPMSSNKDENFIYHFLRRVSSEKDKKEVIVYGMYKWLEMKSDIIEYLNVQKIRISLSNYIDNDQNEIKTFKRRYFEKYREFPSEDVLEGYDIMKYSIQSLNTDGPDFQFKNINKTVPCLETSFQIRPVYKSGKTPENSGDVDYFENAFVRIVELRNNKFRVID